MRKLSLALILFAILWSAGLGNAQNSGGFKVIAHRDNPVDFLSKAQASRLLLKKVTKWDDGTKAQPIDLPSDSPIRKLLSEQIHGRSVGAIKSYWQQKIFSGRAVPPPEKKTDAEVVAFVRSNRGAIGYVSVNAAVSSVKVLEVGE